MRKQMSRGKQQILFNYLPGKTVDYEGGVIARIEHIRGIQVRDLNVATLLARIQEQAGAWPDAYRPNLRDEVLSDPARFVILDPKSVEAEFFPKVFWCSHSACGRVYDSARRRLRAGRKCEVCGHVLNQLRWVCVHRCGELTPLSPPFCGPCGSSDHMALDTRGSERSSNFLWVCRSCGGTQSVYPGNCRACNWQGPANLRLNSLEVHRGGRTFYAHTTTLLNVPSNSYAGFFATPQWKALVAAKYLGLASVADLRFDEVRNPGTAGTSEATGLSAGNLDELLRRQKTGELSTEQLLAELQQAQQRAQAAAARDNFTHLAADVVQYTGVSIEAWEDLAQGLLEALLPSEIAHPRSLKLDPPSPHANDVLTAMGMDDLELLSEFPIVLASYGYTRVEPAPRRPGGGDVLCRLNPFPQDREHDGRWPIFVDETTADALLVRLNSVAVVDWLRANGANVVLPRSATPEVAARSYTAHLLSGIQLRETISSSAREARMVFGLLHTLSHLLVKEAALLCGLDRTSLAEYLLPPALAFAIYSNHKSGQTIGALTALFEQSLSEWVAAARDRRRCVYDPVCREDGGACHACAHLSETSCRFFNMNLSRAFLFGGHDSELGDIAVGYLDMPRS